MREILFQGKAKNNGEWVQGDLHNAKWKYDEKQTSLIWPKNIELEEHYEFSESIEVIPETVGQYTGLPDKNGKKIFEKHVVKITGMLPTVNGLYKVVWDDKNHCFGLKRDTSYHHHYFTFSELNGFHEDCEVIGNIFDNPELMEEAQG